MLEHFKHDATKKESTHLDLRVNGKLHRKTGTTAVFNRQIAIYINMPTLTVINIIKMASNQNAPKRWIGVHMIEAKVSRCFDEMVEIDYGGDDFHDPTTNVRRCCALAIAKPTPRGY